MLTSIFIIDDDPIDCFIANKVIASSIEKSKITSFHSATTALEALQESAHFNPLAFPHFIFLDINMPLMDGFTFLDHFLCLPTQITARTSVFMLSSSVSVADITKAMNYPIVNTYLVKPLTSIILEKVLEDVSTSPKQLKQITTC